MEVSRIHVFMLVYCKKKCLLWIVDNYEIYSSSTFIIYSRYAVFFDDISTVQNFPVDGLWSHNL